MLEQREWCISCFAFMRVLFDLPEASGALSVSEFERASLVVDPYADGNTFVTSCRKSSHCTAGHQKGFRGLDLQLG